MQLGEEFEGAQIVAQVMISVDPKLANQVVRALKPIRAIKALYTVNGVHDLLATVRTGSTQELDRALDAIGVIEGIERTASSIVLSTKFER